MSDPRRLLETGSDLEVAVLESARDDAAPVPLRRRVHLALGLGAAIGGAGTATTATTAAAAATKGTGILASTLAVKSIGVVVIGGVAAAGAAAYVETRSTETAAVVPREAATVAEPGNRTPQSIPTATVPAAATESPAPVQLVPASLSAPDVAGTAAPPAAPAPAAIIGTRPANPLPTATPSSSATPDLASELAPLDAAHGALDSGDPARALQELDRHDRDFPHGRLAPETLVLRIEAYAKRGDDTKVLELARAFLARYPTYPQARHIESIANSIKTKTNP